jgi:transposase-like protein
MEIQKPLNKKIRTKLEQWRARRAGANSRRKAVEVAPEIAVGDGARGFWKALDEVFPATRHQRCWVHKTANTLNKAL